MAILITITRIALGLLLIVAGVLKAHDGMAATASSIAAYRILPAAVVGPMGVALPYAEMLIGGMLALGLFARVAAYIASGQFLLFAAGVASLVIRQIPADCGCFGSGVKTPPSWGHVAGDLALALVAFGVARFGPGLLVADDWLGGGTGVAQDEA
jgi:uncharacterized membrane protein YphA (DoxX/SURF4 family)